MFELAPLTEEATVVAERLLGQAVRAVFPAGSGANSHVFRVETNSGPVALKCYPERPADIRPRAEIEWLALTFLRKHGVSAVPEAFAREGDRYLVMEWVTGSPPAHPTRADFDHAAAFISRIFALSAEPEEAVGVSAGIRGVSFGR